MTLPDPPTAQFIMHNLIPVRVDVRTGQDVAMDFQIKYTPTIVMVDGAGKEQSRSVGFLRPPELIPSLMLGIAKADFNQSAYEQAAARLNELLSEYPQSQSAGEASILKREAQNRLESR